MYHLYISRNGVMAWLKVYSGELLYLLHMLNNFRGHCEYYITDDIGYILIRGVLNE